MQQTAVSDHCCQPVICWVCAASLPCLEARKDNWRLWFCHTWFVFVMSIFLFYCMWTLLSMELVVYGLYCMWSLLYLDFVVCGVYGIYITIWNLLYVELIHMALKNNSAKIQDLYVLLVMNT